MIAQHVTDVMVEDTGIAGLPYRGVATCCCGGWSWSSAPVRSAALAEHRAWCAAAAHRAVESLDEAAERDRRDR